MRLLALAALPIGLAFAVPAHADTDPEYTKCMDTATTNQDFSVCGATMVDRSDARLNKVWKEANKDIDAALKAALLEEQRAWIVFKDKSCLAWTTGAFGREGQVIGFYTCRSDVIDARIDYLENLGDPGEPEADTPEGK